VEIVRGVLRDGDELGRILLLAQLREEGRLDLVVCVGNPALEKAAGPVREPPAGRVPEGLDRPAMLDCLADAAHALDDEAPLPRALAAVREQARRKLELVVRDGQPPVPRRHTVSVSCLPVVTRDDGLAARLAATTLALVDTPSESRHEDEIAELVAARVPLDVVYRNEATFLFATARTEHPLVVLAG